jgi:hypothetical protein
VQEKTMDNNKENKTDNNQNEQLLNVIYNICKTSIHSIEDVITSAKDEINFQNEITKQHDKYDVISKECSMLAKAFSINLTHVDYLSKFKNWVNVKLNTLIDCSTSNLAKILYGGISCEIPEIILQRCKNKQADADILDLGERLLHLQEDNIHELKKFLCKGK